MQPSIHNETLPANEEITPSWDFAVDSKPKIEEKGQSGSEIPLPVANPTPTPTPAPEIYACEMEIRFISGPLEGKGSEFTILDRSYFTDKGDQFAPGKGTGIYYESQNYFIIHSSFANGNILDPMEAEFIRKYLEYWGDPGPEYIQEQIDTLIDSEMVWICNGRLLYKTKIKGVTRLSHEASNRLWLEPESLPQILKNKEGLVSEWVGTIEQVNTTDLWIAFCGWGSRDLGDARYTHFRYLLQFEVIL